MNHRFGFYLISVLMIVMLGFIYLDVRRLSADVDALLQSTQNEMEFNPAKMPLEADLDNLNDENQTEGMTDNPVISEGLSDEVLEVNIEPAL